MKNLEFPFSYRKGQKEMVAGIYHAIAEEEQIFIQAPTGIGKTMSAIFSGSPFYGKRKRRNAFI